MVRWREKQSEERKKNSLKRGTRNTQELKYERGEKVNLQSKIGETEREIERERERERDRERERQRE